MNEYQLTITKRLPNPEYGKQMDAYGKQMDAYLLDQNNGYYRNSSMPLNPPQPFVEGQVLSVTVDEATFNAIRKAALETL